MKVEEAQSPNVKPEPSDDGVSTYPDDDDVYEDTGDLEFPAALPNLWLGHVPRSLWEAVASLPDEEEIEIGTVRVENSNDRVSLKFHTTIPQLQDYPKEYSMYRSVKDVEKKHGQAFIFSERDLAGYKSRGFDWDHVDEDGHRDQGRSYLYERNKREQKKKENRNRRLEPYTRRPIPKQTALTGLVESEYDCLPVKNEEYFALESKQAQNMLKIPEKQQTTLVQGRYEPKTTSIYLSMAEKANINRQNQLRKQAAKDGRAARVDRQVLLDKLMELFKEHRYWGLKSVKSRVNQPEAYLKEILQEIAFLHKQGDFASKWELLDQYRTGDTDLLNPSDLVAPGGDESGMEQSGLDDEDENDDFEDV